MLCITYIYITHVYFAYIHISLTYKDVILYTSTHISSSVSLANTVTKEQGGNKIFLLIRKYPDTNLCLLCCGWKCVEQEWTTSNESGFRQPSTRIYLVCFD